MCSGWLFFSILSPKNVVDPKICYILEFFFTSGLDLLHQTEPQSHRFHSRIRAFLGHQRYFLERKPNFTTDIKVKKLFKNSKKLNFEFSRPLSFSSWYDLYRPIAHWLVGTDLESRPNSVRPLWSKNCSRALFMLWDFDLRAPKNSLSLRSRQRAIPSSCSCKSQ